MIITPFDIVNILTAATPIVVSMFTGHPENKKKEDSKEYNSEPKVVINNNFYTRTEEEAIKAASKVNEDFVNFVKNSSNRYTL